MQKKHICVFSRCSLLWKPNYCAVQWALQSTTHGNPLWDSAPSKSVFSEEVGLTKKPQFSFPAFPQVGQQGSTFLLEQKKNRAISPAAGFIHKDISPSPVGNTWMHAHDMSAATEIFSMALSRNGACIINLAKERIHVKHYTCSSL